MITTIIKYMSNITCDKEMVNEMKLHMLMLMNVWMMLVLRKCKCQMQCLTLGCYRRGGKEKEKEKDFYFSKGKFERIFIFTTNRGINELHKEKSSSKDLQHRTLTERASLGRSTSVYSGKYSYPSKYSFSF